MAIRKGFPFLYFNSIKVQLELNVNPVTSFRLEFQFHKGTIRTTKETEIRSKQICDFNSIKVQLEHETSLRTFARAHKFQFHKGTIRTLAPNKAVRSVFVFQFHKGTIRTFRLRWLLWSLRISIP